MKDEDDDAFLALFFCEEVSDDFFLLMLKVFLLAFLFVGGMFSCE